MPKISRSYWIFWYIFSIWESDNEWIILITSCKNLIINLTSASYWFPWADDITKASTILLAREQRPWAPSHFCLILILLPSELVVPGAIAQLDSAIGLTLVHSGGPGNGSLSHLILSSSAFLSRTSTTCSSLFSKPFVSCTLLSHLFLEKCSASQSAVSAASQRQGQHDESSFCRCPPVSKWGISHPVCSVLSE